MIDIHSHIPDEKIITILATEKPDEWLKAFSFLPNNLPAIGLHPNFLSSLENVDDYIFNFEREVDKFFAISEVGLDFKSKNDNQIQLQIKILTKIMEIAEKHNKVIIVHNRKSIEKFLELRSSFKVRTIYHNYEGNLSQLNKIIESGDFISISTSYLRFKKDNIIKKVPLENLFFETDSPALSPFDSPNKPENVRLIVEYFSKLRNISIEYLENQIRSNFVDLFSKTSSAYFLHNLDLYK
ncbi:MAG: TatD family hydrolase [Candidatus Rehaiarchaeum fermentans]|nr:TatD family hydrolase [Candidatus Rehaiarchaeum fermentans]MCW1302411.1 TatD family hydrolase [Candidatus Rehaiarchaeum fermentans]